jgi:hypothetical protein
MISSSSLVIDAMNAQPPKSSAYALRKAIVCSNQPDSLNASNRVEIGYTRDASRPHGAREYIDSFDAWEGFTPGKRYPAARRFSGKG